MDNEHVGGVWSTIDHKLCGARFTHHRSLVTTIHLSERNLFDIWIDSTWIPTFYPRFLDWFYKNLDLILLAFWVDSTCFLKWSFSIFDSIKLLFGFLYSLIDLITPLFGLILFNFWFDSNCFFDLILLAFWTDYTPFWIDSYHYLTGFHLLFWFDSTRLLNWLHSFLDW